MQPIDEFRWSLSIVRKLFKIISQDIFDVNHRNGYIFYVILAFWLITDYFYLSTILDDQYEMIIRFNCVSMLFGAIQVNIYLIKTDIPIKSNNISRTSQATFKYYLLQDLKQLIPIIEFIADMYEKNSAKTSKYYGICRQYARITKLTVKIGISLYFAAMAIITLSGTFESIIRNIRKPSMVIYFPGIHEYSTEMFATLCAYNYAMVVISFLTVLQGDMLFFVIFANVPMVPSIIRGQLEELTNVLQEKNLNVVDIKRRIQQYFQMHRRFNE